MAKLYFRYGAMNSGKSTALLQTAYNYEERNMRVVVLKPSIDTKGAGAVVSRLGANRQADRLLQPQDSVRDVLDAAMASSPLHCVLVDEAQFLQPAQIDELFWFAVEQNIPVISYGLRTDFTTKGFPAASRLLVLAHELNELKTICRCGKKAVLNGRTVHGQFVQEGSQIAIDDMPEVEYEALCAADYNRLVRKA